VYLYIINYAKSKPDLAIMAIATFTKDAKDKRNPMMRALSVRTMSCIRVERIAEYLCESLKDCLSDEDPYVKKTAAISIAKLYMTSPRLVKDYNLVKMLQGMLGDGNAIVVANVCASLLEISKAANKNYIKLRSGGNLNKLLAALNDSNEWGQVYILEAVATYDPETPEEASSIIERILPRLQHSNASVVMAAVKAILKFIDFLESNDKEALKEKEFLHKMAAPLTTLLAAEPEIQYVALRNIDFIL